MRIAEADELGVFLQDIGEDIGASPAETMNMTISTPDYFAASVHQSITQERMLNLGANVLYSVIFCVKNMQVPNFDENIKEKINKHLENFRTSAIKKRKYDLAMHNYGLMVSVGDTFVVSLARRVDIINYGSRLKEEYNVQDGNEGTAIAKTFNELIGSVIASTKETTPRYVA
jgi:hypothetical protein